MGANENLDSEVVLDDVSSELPIRPEAIPPLQDNVDEDDSWMDVHTLNFVPYKNVKKIQITVRHCGRGKPLPHPGIWDDDE